MGPSDRYAVATLSANHLAWFDSLPLTLRLSDDVLLVHGTPDSDLTYFLETVTPEGLRQATEAEIKHRAGDVDAAVVLCGHTHLAGVVKLADGRLIVNPGSVGLPAYDDDRPYPMLSRLDRLTRGTRPCLTKAENGQRKSSASSMIGSGPPALPKQTVGRNGRRRFERGAPDASPASHTSACHLQMRHSGPTGPRPESRRSTAAPSRLQADIDRKTPVCRASARNGKLFGLAASGGRYGCSSHSKA